MHQILRAARDSLITSPFGAKLVIQTLYAGRDQARIKGRNNDMTLRTVKESSFEAYLELEYPSGCSEESSLARASEIEDRNRRLSRFPYAIVLELSYPEVDVANRFCWNNFGPADGDCTQSFSNYPLCTLKEPHNHRGTRASHWHVKTEYDFGFNEWYFEKESDFDRFCENIANINWGEKYPK